MTRRDRRARRRSPSCSRFAEELERRRQPARGPRRLAAGLNARDSPRNRRKPGASASRACARLSAREVEEKLKPRIDRVGSRQARRGRRLQRRLHPRRQSCLSVDRWRCFPFFIVAAAVAHLLGQSQDAQLTVDQRPAPAAARRRRDLARAGRRSADRRAPGRCCGSARSSGCGRRPASSRRSATSCAAPMA